MNNYVKIPLILIAFVSCFWSCNDLSKEVSSWMEVKETSKIDGTYHFLENDGIKVFLPEVFERYSAYAYEKVLDSIATKKDYELEKDRLNYLRDLEGNFYIYFDDLSRSTFTVNTIPYMTLEKKDAQLLLGIMRQSYEKLIKDSNLSYKKVTASYSETSKVQVFKAIFKINNYRKKTETFQTNYFVSSDDKTFFIKLTTSNLVNFDPYLKKIIL